MSLPHEITAGLVTLGLLDDSDVRLTAHQLAGGVSSDIWRVDLPSGPVCAKRALGQLRVEGNWRASTARSRWEARWLAEAGAALPVAVPRLIGFDPNTDTLVLEWLDQTLFANWKDQLLAGHIDAEVGAAVGARLAALHADMGRGELPSWEPSAPLFEQLRITPYLRVSAERNPEVRHVLLRHAEHLADARVAVVHGDVSPKNILIGPDGPVLIDAECASPGDPAFDLAFCTNHLLLKAVHLPRHAHQFLVTAGVLSSAYLNGVQWESPSDLERRTAQLVPALLLARIDGLSPVEYLDPHGSDTVRQAATELLLDPPETLPELFHRWPVAISLETEYL